MGWVFRKIGVGFLLFSLPLFANQNLVLVGGGVAPEEAYQHFTKLAGGDAGRYLMVVWSTTDPEENYESFKKRLRPYTSHLEHVQESPLINEIDEPKMLEKFESQLEEADGVAFSGGYQDKAMKVFLAHPELMKMLLTKYQSGKAVVMGTSAGTALMSNPMIDSDLSDPKKFWTEVGLGLLPGVIVDQHFFARHREARLAQVLRDVHFPVGVGIDEDSAALIEENHLLTALGTKGEDPNVLILDERANLDTSPKRKELWPGDTWDLSRPL